MIPTCMKNQNPLVSIIIPIYNAEAYLRTCLLTVTNQTYKNLEILCIENGSVDRSVDILQEFMSKDSRVRIIRLPTAVGSGVANNTGYAHAAGTYVRGVDADDYLPTNSTELMVRAAIANQVDIVKGGYKYLNEHSVTNGYRYPKEFALRTADHRDILSTANHWTYLFKRSWIQAHGIRYSNALNGNDGYFMTSVLKHMKCVLTIPEPVYYYRKVQTSVTNTRRGLQYYENIFDNYERFSQLLPALYEKWLLENDRWYLPMLLRQAELLPTMDYWKVIDRYKRLFTLIK